MNDAGPKGTLRVVRYVDAIESIWKNGLGQSKLIAKSPEGCVSDDFDWQISLARMTGSLPFSDYPGVDRSLYVIAGQGLHVRSPIRDVTLLSDSEVLEFDGSEKIVGTTIGTEEMHDFNILSKQGRVKHRSRRTPISQVPFTLTVAGTSIIYVQAGKIDIASGGLKASIEAGDSAILESAEKDECQISSKIDSICIISEIFAA
jgi:uncharacterized protein